MAGNSRSGRRKNPDAVRKIIGMRKREALDPQYPQTLPAMPELVSADPIATAKWLVLSARIAAAQVLTEAHGEMLALLCLAWADLDRARTEFRDAGNKQMVCDETINGRGDVSKKYKINPIASRIEHQAAQVARFLGEFGLTPMTAGKVAAKPSADVDPFAQFLEDDGDIYASRRAQ